MKRTVSVAALSVLLWASAAQADAVADRLAEYQAAGAGPFTAAAGETLWNSTHPDPDGGAARSCTSCHTADLTQPGKHARTGKVVDPMAPSVNPTRLTDGKKIEKWFLRNCKWTFGRECTPQEKGDVLSFIKSR